MQSPHIIALPETHTSGAMEDEVCQKFGFHDHYRVEVRRHQAGIWILWNRKEINLTLLHAHAQYDTMKVCYRGVGP